MADLFISYARADQPFAERLAALMEQQGWSVWWDRDLVPGNIFDEVIERELGLASAVLVLWSSASVRSQWVRSEASLAAERGNLIPVLTDSTAMPLRFRNLQAVDLSEWDGSATDGRLARLFAGIQSLAGPPAPPRHQLPCPPSRLRRPASHASPGPDTPSSEQISAATVPSIAATAPLPPTTTPPTTPALTASRGTATSAASAAFSRPGRGRCRCARRGRDRRHGPHQPVFERLERIEPDRHCRRWRRR